MGQRLGFRVQVTHQAGVVILKEKFTGQIMNYMKDTEGRWIIL